MNDIDQIEMLRRCRDLLTAIGSWNPSEPPQGMLVNMLHDICPHDTNGLVWNSLYAALNELGHTKGTISVWERMVDRRQAEVIDLLDRAIEIAQSRLHC